MPLLVSDMVVTRIDEEPGCGNVSRRKLGAELRGDPPDTSDQVDCDRLESPVTSMRIIRMGSADAAYLVAGDEDGCVRIWNAQ